LNPYELLGVPKDANLAEIKKAYRKLAKERHPDQGGSTEEMAKLARAYLILSDPEKRKRFDETGSDKEPDFSGEMHMAFATMCEKIFFAEEDRNAKNALEVFSATLEREYNAGKERIAAQRRILERAKGRIVKAPEFDLLGGLIAQRLLAVKGLEDLNNREYKTHSEALKLLQAYVFNEPMERSQFVRMFDVTINGMKMPDMQGFVDRKS